MSLDAYQYVSDWLARGEGKLLVRTGKVDIGQRISTALLAIVREELTLPLAQIEVCPVRTGDSPDEGMTSGSNSIEHSGGAIRHAAATLREAALARAAERYGGDVSDWVLEEGGLSGPGTNTPLPLLDLLEDPDFALAVSRDVPVGLHPRAPVPMRGLEDLVTGAYRFVQDIDVPQMRHARVVRPPHRRARLLGVAEDAAGKLRDRGVEVIVDGTFVAVAAADEWAAVQAATRLAAACSWDGGGGLPEGDIFAELTQANALRLRVVDGLPDPEAEIPQKPAAASLTARYERPFTMHGALAPSAAFARFEGGQLRIVTHSQGIYPLRDSIADSLGLAPGDVILTHGPGSGCYGHNGADDAAFEAALVAMALPGVPILLKWSREEEHAWEPYGPASAIELSAQTDATGALAALRSEALGGTYRGRPRPGPERAGPARLLANSFRADPIGPAISAPNMNRQGGLHRNLDPVYDIPDTVQVKNLIRHMPLRTSALRCLGAALNAFGLESLMDELAHSTGADPIAYRKAHLGDPRALAVLARLATEVEMLAPCGEGEGLGIAYAQYKNAMTRTGIAVTLRVNDLAQVVLQQAVIVADAGRIVDRPGLEAQLEGGFLQGASWALHEAVTWDRDGITSRDWDSYPVLRFDNIPQIKLVLLEPEGAASVGAGEATPGPAMAAIANAIFAATGLRLRRVPFTPEAITSAALQV